MLIINTNKRDKIYKNHNNLIHNYTWIVHFFMVNLFDKYESSPKSVLFRKHKSDLHVSNK